MKFISYPSGKDDWEIFKKNNLKTAIKVSCNKKVSTNKDENEETNPVYILKHNSECQKQFFLWIVLNKDRWHYAVVTKLSTFSSGITFFELS